MCASKRTRRATYVALVAGVITFGTTIMSQCTQCGLFNPPLGVTCLSCGSTLAVPAASAVMAPLPGMPAGGPSPLAAPEPTLSPGPSRQEEYSHILGPVDRESFFAAQRRHRRATWKMTAACALAAVVTGLPLSLALTPIIFAVIVILTRLAGFVTTVPVEVWDAYRWAGSTFVRVGDYFIEEEMQGPAPIAETLAVAAIWLVPGILLMLLVWPILRSLFRSAGVGGVLLSLGARDPNMLDLEERQLVNVVEEMAIAAGLPAPRVMLLDAPVANAAVVGSSPRDAVIVVCRPLLDDLNRDETQGVLGHLIAAIGNGDLRVALSVVALFQTFGFAGALLRAPVSREARQTLWRMLRYVFSRHPPAKRAEEAQRISGLLTGAVWDLGSDEFGEGMDEKPVEQRRGLRVIWLMYLPVITMAILVVGLIMEWPREGFTIIFGVLGALALATLWYQRVYVAFMIRYAIATVRAVIMLPYYFGVIMPQLLLGMVIPFILEPLLGLLWRTRRYLADARAVQLTRNPDGLAYGLRGLVTRGGGIPGGKWATPLFIVCPERLSYAQIDPEMAEEMRENRQRFRPGVIGDAQAMREQARGAGVKMVAQAIAEGKSESRSYTGSTTGSLGGLHPPLHKRLKRLRSMGATAPGSEERARIDAGYSRRFGWLMAIVGGGLLTLVAVLMVVAAALMLAMGFVACSVMMMMVYGLVIALAPA
ncbi:MAG TPA: M48 family metalloprotease [Thermomicrobiales bacterium]|nr:M48 family metalloprotease [Thermomicrobiales bacterium]